MPLPNNHKLLESTTKEPLIASHCPFLVHTCKAEPVQRIVPATPSPAVLPNRKAPLKCKDSPGLLTPTPRKPLEETTKEASGALVFTLITPLARACKSESKRALAKVPAFILSAFW